MLRFRYKNGKFVLFLCFISLVSSEKDVLRETFSIVSITMLGKKIRLNLFI